jgi:type IV fimbrial biogenesis protein FimT
MRTALNMHPGGRYNSGFTMLEVVIVIAIVTILLMVGVPSFQYVTTANRISGEVNGLIGDMQFARAEAIKEGQTVVVCVSNGNAATPGCGTGNSWQNGWVVCSDPAGDGTCDAGQPVFRVQNAFTSTDTFQASGGTSTVTFNREGFAVGLPGIVTIALHNVTNVTSYTRCLAISAVGTLAVQTAGVGSCT